MSNLTEATVKAATKGLSDEAAEKIVGANATTTDPKGAGAIPAEALDLDI